MKETTKGTLAIVTAAVIWGFTGVCIKKFYSAGMGMITLMAFSSFFSLLLVLLFNGKQIDFKPKKEAMIWLFALFLFGNATAFTFNSSYKFTTVANAVFLHYTMPLFTFIIVVFFLKEKITKWKFLALALSVIGISLVFNIRMISDITDLANLGNILALISALTYAMIIISSRKLKGTSPFTMFFWNMLLSSILLAFLLPFSFILQKPSQLVWLFLYTFLFIYTGLSLFYYGARKIEASRASIIMLLEVVVAVVAAYFILGETLTVPKLIGGLFIMVSSLILIIKQNHGN